MAATSTHRYFHAALLLCIYCWASGVSAVVAHHENALSSRSDRQRNSGQGTSLRNVPEQPTLRDRRKHVQRTLASFRRIRGRGRAARTVHRANMKSGTDANLVLNKSSKDLGKDIQAGGRTKHAQRTLPARHRHNPSTESRNLVQSKLSGDTELTHRVQHTSAVVVDDSNGDLKLTSPSEPNDDALNDRGKLVRRKLSRVSASDHKLHSTSSAVVDSKGDLLLNLPTEGDDNAANDGSKLVQRKHSRAWKSDDTPHGNSAAVVDSKGDLHMIFPMDKGNTASERAKLVRSKASTGSMATRRIHDDTKVVIDRSKLVRSKSPKGSTVAERLRVTSTAVVDSRGDLEILTPREGVTAGFEDSLSEGTMVPTLAPTAPPPVAASITTMPTAMTAAPGATAAAAPLGSQPQAAPGPAASNDAGSDAPRVLLILLALSLFVCIGFVACMVISRRGQQRRDSGRDAFMSRKRSTRQHSQLLGRGASRSPNPSPNASPRSSNFSQASLPMRGSSASLGLPRISVNSVGMGSDSLSLPQSPRTYRERREAHKERMSTRNSPRPSSKDPAGRDVRPSTASAGIESRSMQFLLPPTADGQIIAIDT